MINISTPELFKFDMIRTRITRMLVLCQAHVTRIYTDYKATNKNQRKSALSVSSAFHTNNVCLMKRILSSIAIIFASISAFSQSVTETRQIKTTALQIYEKYREEMKGLFENNAYTEDNFMALFDSVAVIYNDITPDNQPQQLSPADYYQKFKANIRRIHPVFSDFKMGEPVFAGNKWRISCNYTRATRFKTQKDLKYPEWTFHYTMTIEMDKRYDTNTKVFENAKIVSVDVENPLKGFFVIENKENIPLQTQSGEMLQDWDAEYQSRIFPKDKWNIFDIVIPESIVNDGIFEFSRGKLSKNQTEANFYQIDVQRLNVFGVGVNYSPISFGKIISKEDVDNFKVDKYLNAFSLSFFYGKQIYHKEKSTVFLNVGLDFNRYSHIYKNDDWKKFTFNISSVSVPLSVQYLYQLTQQTKKPIFLSFELGVFAEHALASWRSNPNYKKTYYDDEPYKELKKTQKLKMRSDCGAFVSPGLWFALNERNLLNINISCKYDINSTLKYINHYVNQSCWHSTKNSLQMGFGISWVKTIGAKK